MVALTKRFYGCVFYSSINRRSLSGVYPLGLDGLPLNPTGRTGLRGRGRLSRWGPNHCDSVVLTRVKQNENGEAVFLKGVVLY